MQQKYLTNEMRNLSRTQLANRSQQDGEDVQKFADEIEKMVGRGYAHFGNEARDEMAKDFFLRGLKPNIKNWIWNQTMADFQAAVNEATRRELLVNDLDTAEKVRKPCKVRDVSPSGGPKWRATENAGENQPYPGEGRRKAESGWKFCYTRSVTLTHRSLSSLSHSLRLRECLYLLNLKSKSELRKKQLLLGSNSELSSF